MNLSPRLSLTYLAPQQAQKHVSVNETFRRLDALVQLRVNSQSAAVEPAAPSEGDAFILPAGKTGAAWSAFADNAIAVFQDGAWAEIAPGEGFFAYVADEGSYYRFAGGNWGAFSAWAAGGSTILGVNTTADATNRFAVKSDASLFSHDDVTPGAGDHRLKINKNASANTASVVFQNGASGRAEIGLTGDDDLHFKVSADGAAWIEPLTFDKATGLPTFNAIGSTSIRVRTASDAFNPVISYVDASPGQARVGAFNFVDDTGATVGQTAYFFNKAAPASQFYRIFVNSAERLKVTGDGSVVVGAPAGGAKGDGTINAKAVYDDNALLSCYVFDAALDGRIDLGKWDAKTPAERHDGARRFAARLGTPHDPLTLDGYAAHWREKRHLPSLPNEAAFDPAADKLSTGEWIQRLIETVEIQAVLIEALNARVRVLEAI